ncbi:hypothetical protein PUMCH_004310 [Australozyma saopauloensis]|uniref:Uncharacterized protein n=1 Tax=Australozyma saopauloensis TaxID=291208 RepID=A0AAX4HEW0_9ASCO|nr:hypothetical protein PUMCH_004310 [[Candida] saopauloensis]
MDPTQKTPLQHNSTLFISPHVTRKVDVFVTPPNPHNNLFETPGSLLSLFFNPENVTGEAPNQLEHPSLGATEEPLSRAEKLRLWRHDAFMQHQYETAEYIGDKILSLTNDPNDAFWLAQVHFNRGDYLRAYNLLTSKPEYEQSLACRYLCGYSLVKLERWDDALDVLGETNPFRDQPYKARTVERGTRLEASMCYLRGLIYASQTNFERAKEAYQEAVMVDVKCYEAFNELINNDFMTPAEQWEFINQLNYADAEDNDELVKLLYTTKLSKYMNLEKFEEAETILKDEYRLGDNTDVLLSRVNNFYVRCNYDECCALCEKLLNDDPYNFNILAVYISCLYELGGRNKLFLRAHQLADNHPAHPLTWFAIGTYYLSIGKVLEARKFFGKANMLNPNICHGWIGFAHTFAIEKEHEQAVSAYAFAARLFPGNHFPNLFLGMQHVAMKSFNLAEEYLLASYEICNTDPLLLNELGVVHYHKKSWHQAEACFREALGAAKYINSDSKSWISIHVNLGHVYRMVGDYHKAMDCFTQALKLSPRNDSNIFTSIGFVHLKLRDEHKAIEFLHEALAVNPSDTIAADLLKRALESNSLKSNAFMQSMNQNSPDLSQSVNIMKAWMDRKMDHPITSISENILDTPLIGQSRFHVHRRDPNSEHDVNELAEQLRRGEDSSGEEIMEIESE